MLGERQMLGRERLTVVKALLWEQWRQTWVVLAAAVVAGGLASLTLFIWTFAFPEFSGDATEIAIFFNIVFMGLPFLLVPLSHCDKNNLQASLPQRILALPVSTRTLGAVYLGYRMLALGATASVMALLIALAALGENMGSSVPAPYLPLFGKILLMAPLAALLAMFVYAYVQALLWTLGSIHLGLAGVGFWVLTPALFSLHQVLWSALTGVVLRPLISCCLLLSYFVGFVALAYLGFSLQRKDVWAGVRDYAALRLGHRTRVVKPFASAAQAQEWFEWRRRGRVFRTATLSFLFVFLVVFAGSRIFPTDTDPALRWAPEYFAIVSLFALTLGSCLAGMLSMTLDYRDHVTGLNLFTMTRCLPTRGIAAARLRAMAWSVGSTYIILLAGLFVWVLVTGTEDQFANMIVEFAGYDRHSQEWSGMGQGAPMDGGTPIPLNVLALSSVIALLAVLGHAVLVWAVISFFGPLFLMLLLVNGSGLLACVLVAAFIVWAYVEGRRRVITGAPSAVWAGVRGVGIVSSLMVLFYFPIGPGLARWNEVSPPAPAGGGWLLAWMIGTLACCVPFVVTPVWVHWLRHR